VLRFGAVGRQVGLARDVTGDPFSGTCPTRRRERMHQPESSQYPVEVGLTDMFVGGSRPVLALAALIATLPLALVFVVSQRAIVRGLLNGAATG
jgi:hypothetical protein